MLLIHLFLFFVWNFTISLKDDMRQNCHQDNDSTIYYQYFKAPDKDILQPSKFSEGAATLSGDTLTIKLRNDDSKFETTKIYIIETKGERIILGVETYSLCMYNQKVYEPKNQPQKLTIDYFSKDFIRIQMSTILIHTDSINQSTDTLRVWGETEISITERK